MYTATRLQYSYLYSYNNLTPEEYLQFEETSLIKHEYIDGQVYAMAGTKDTHNIVLGNIYTIICNHLRGSDCRVYFADVKVRLEKRNAFKEHRDKKEELINKAKVLQESSDWKASTESLKKLQEQWKAVGSADPRDEQKLWQRFRSACDVFFTRKKEHFGEMVAQQEENLRLKTELLVEIESTELSGNKGEDLALLKSFGERWHAVGFVPKEQIKSIMDRYNAALDVKYGQINAEREEREMSAFRNRVDNIKSSGAGDTAVKKERFLLKDKLDKLSAQIKQYENNMGFFTGKGAEAMRKEIEKKIKTTEREMEDIKKKMSLLEG